METSALIDWIRNFADHYYHLLTPSKEQVRRAIATHLPQKLSECPFNADAQELLERVSGIVVIVKLGDEQIAWGVAVDRPQADTMQQTYSSAPYSAVRDDLGIDAHWILLVNPDFMFTQRDLYEAHMDLMELEDQPECVLVPL